MKRAVADTSALVSLALSGKMLELVVKTIALETTVTVKSELKEISMFKDEKGRAAKKALAFIESGKIGLQRLSNPTEPGKLVTKNVDIGEAECFCLAQERKIPTILMDDLSASYHLSEKAAELGIKMRISAAAISELLLTRKISKEKARAALARMIRNRKWEKTTMEYLVKKTLGEG